MATDFSSLLDEVEPGEAKNPFAVRVNDEWIEGMISIDFLQTHFGQYSTAAEMIAATNSEGLKLYFQWLADNGKIPQ